MARTLVVMQLLSMSAKLAEQAASGSAVGEGSWRALPGPSSTQPSAAPDVAEVYSPPRVTKEAIKYQLKPGEAIDLTMGWNFYLKDDQNAAERLPVRRPCRVAVQRPLAFCHQGG